MVVSSTSIMKTEQGMSASGALTFSSVKGLLSQANEFIDEFAQSSALSATASTKEKITFEIDCSAIQHIDSAGIALLIEWQRQCIKANINSRFVGLQDQPKSLIKTYQLQSLIAA